MHSFQKIDRPTRIKDTSATLIDNIFTNTHQNDTETGVWLADTDHLPIFIVIVIVIVIVIPYHVTKPNKGSKFSVEWIYSETNMEHFKNVLANINWSVVLDKTSTDEQYEAFNGILKELHDTKFPLTKF